MRILHVHSANGQITGSVTYAAALADRQISSGHEVLIVSDVFNVPTQAEIISFPISIRSLPQRVRNQQFIRKVVKERQIDIVHAHSRAASWVSHFGVKGTSALYVSTIHGRQKLHLSVKLYHVYGDAVIAVCENLRQHLIYEVKLPPDKVAVIPNGISFPPPIERRVGESAPTIAVIGRAGGRKGKLTAGLIHNVFESLMREYPDLHIRIVGGREDQFPPAAIADVNRLNRDYGNRIVLDGFLNSLGEVYSSASPIIGAGRVAIEALANGVPTLAAGESEIFGVVDASNIERAAASNFGDSCATVSTGSMDYQTALIGIRNCLISPPESCAEWVRECYDIDNVAMAIEELYYEQRMRKFHPRHIPVLMYHKTPDAPIESSNRTFVVRDNLRKHFAFFRMAKRTPITFREYDEWRRALRSMETFPRRPIILTFDDGYRDNHTNLLPFLCEFGLKCVIFALADPDLKRNTWDVADPEAPLMNLNELRDFVAIGCEIGSHGITHRAMTELSEEECNAELLNSKSYFERELGIQPVTFAYPYGLLNDQVKGMTCAAGYSYAVATDSGALLLEADRYAIFRANIFPKETRWSLWKKTSPWYRGYYRRKRGK